MSYWFSWKVCPCTNRAPFLQINRARFRPASDSSVALPAWEGTAVGKHLLWDVHATMYKGKPSKKVSNSFSLHLEQLKQMVHAVYLYLQIWQHLSNWIIVLSMSFSFVFEKHDLWGNIQDWWPCKNPMRVNQILANYLLSIFSRPIVDQSIKRPQKIITISKI